LNFLVAEYTPDPGLGKSAAILAKWTRAHLYSCSFACF